MVLLNYFIWIVFLFNNFQFILLEKVVPIKDESSDINNCQRCKTLTDSFNLWLEKTTRGKYEGGDVAWTEKKLRSYSRSQLRLVEVQENLCSELKHNKDHCYVFNEDAEQLIETWWLNEDPSKSDLYTWLCIENFKYCCPSEHFGISCAPCPVDKNNKMCGGHGKCDGDGTRSGNGTCICNKGFTGKHCEHCANNYYLDYCPE